MLKLPAGCRKHVTLENAPNSARISSSTIAGSAQGLRNFVAEQLPVAFSQAVHRHAHGHFVQAERMRGVRV